MSPNADSVRFKFVCNVHVSAYFEKTPVSGITYLYTKKIAFGLGQVISCINCLVVSDFENYLNDAKEEDILNRSLSPLNGG